MQIRAAIVFIAAFAPVLASAGVLYKSVDANGVVMFSDTPPPEGARILEERALPSTNASPPAEPSFANPVPVQVEQLFDYDAAVARASEQVDLAERALALARRDLWSPNEGLRLASTREGTLAADQRLAPYHKDLKIARRHLAELVRERQALGLRQ